MSDAAIVRLITGAGACVAAYAWQVTPSSPAPWFRDVLGLIALAALAWCASTFIPRHKR